MSILSISDSPFHDNTIEGCEFHSYKPYVNSYNINDEIRIPINQQDLYVLPSESTLYVEGTFNVFKVGASGAQERVQTLKFTNNPILFLFQEIRYELNGVEIDKIKNAGITTTIKSLLSMNQAESNASKVWGWNIDGTQNDKEGNFSFNIPLKNVLGFAEDYKKIIMNCKHELILLRTNTNVNALKLNDGEIIENVVFDKLIWRMPHIKVSDKEKIGLLKYLEKDRAIQIAFRNWDLYEYPLLPKTTKHTWAIKTSSQVEKPRYVILGLQTNRKRTGKADMSQFDHCHLRDVKVYLNSCYYPYESFNANFETNKFALLYEQYMKFQHTYYGRRTEPLLDDINFKNKAPLYIIDCSRQNDTLKTGPVDVRIEIESNKDIPDGTSAYCLILNDSVIEYKPLTNIVRKIS